MITGMEATKEVQCVQSVGAVAVDGECMSPAIRSEFSTYNNNSNN